MLMQMLIMDAFAGISAVFWISSLEWFSLWKRLFNHSIMEMHTNGEDIICVFILSKPTFWRFLKLERVTGLGVTPYREFELFVSDTVVGDELVIQFLVNQCGAISGNWSNKCWIEIRSGMRMSYGISEIATLSSRSVQRI